MSFLQSSADRHLGGFHFLDILHWTAISMKYRNRLHILTFFCLGKSLRVRRLGHIVGLLPDSCEISTLSSRTAVLAHIPTNYLLGYGFPHLLTSKNIFYLMCVCIVLMASDLSIFSCVCWASEFDTLKMACSFPLPIPPFGCTFGCWFYWSVHRSWLLMLYQYHGL